VCWLLLPGLLLLSTAGCGTFTAHRMVQSPNTYPTWFAPKAPVMLAFSPKFLTNFPKQFVEVGPPAARLCYRVIEPADYHLTISSTNWLEHGRKQFEFDFRADVPGRSNVWTSAPRGTVILLHGYGLAQFAMAPWALRLAQEGWRCVLVDLRGHGQSTGKRISFGINEARDLSQLLDTLTDQERLATPVAVIGESYGAALALRWKTTDPRVGQVVAIAPYGVLSNAVLNICRDYAGLVPRAVIRAGLRQLPVVLGVPAGELDTTTVLERHPLTALFVSGSEDDVMPPADVRTLFKESLPGSELIEVPGATHEIVTYQFSELVPPVLAWLNSNEPGHR